jgi:hypothetical protein
MNNLSLEDIQRSSNENNLTDAEQKKVDANEVNSKNMRLFQFT